MSLFKTTILPSIITAAIVSGGMYMYFEKNYPRTGASGPVTATTNTIALGESPIVETVKKVNPAVVSITITKNVPVIEQFFQSPGGLFGNGFFNFSFPQLRQNGTEKREVGGGSGFLVSANGHIVTNRHVVEDPEAEYTVFTNDGKKHSATVVATDPVLDIAVIKIEGSDYPYLEFDDSSKLEVGQTVIAIGNALGEFRNTVSVGVVSGLGRSITAGDFSGKSESLEEVVQTDAAINQGNSGGPLLTIGGKVAGVNVAVASGAQNIGFALPANNVKDVVTTIQKNGKIVRPYIGVRYVEITEDLQKKNNLSVDHGVLVSRGEQSGELAVIPGSPADKAGIVENDIILEANGQKLTPEKSLSSVISGKKVGDTITLKILHRGEEKTISVKLEEMK